jgi:S1-C subfamily serine protease
MFIVTQVNGTLVQNKEGIVNAVKDCAPGQSVAFAFVRTARETV